MLRDRLVWRRALPALVLGLMMAGCFLPGDDAGVALLVTPDRLDFGTRLERLVLSVAKIASTTPVEPIVASTNTPWITLDSCGDSTDNCVSAGPLLPVGIPVRVNREAMRFGINEGEVFLRSGTASVQRVSVRAMDTLEVNFASDLQEVVVGRAVKFTDISSVGAGAAVTARRWDFGDGGASNDANPTYVYRLPGSYTVALTVTAGGQTETKRLPLLIRVISSEPVAQFEASPTTIFVNETVNFTNLSTSPSAPITGQRWDFGDGGTSTEANPSYLYRRTGVFTVRLTINTEFGSRTALRENYIVVRSRVAPRADFITSPVKPFVNEPVQFMDASDPGTRPIRQYLWAFGDGTISIDQNPTHTYRSAGIFTARLTVVTDHGSSTKERQIEATFRPPTAAFSVSAASGFTGVPFTFTDQSTAGSEPINEWLWEFGDGTTSTEQNPVHTYQNPGTYSVTLTVRIPVPSNNSDSITKRNLIQAVIGPVPDFSITLPVIPGRSATDNASALTSDLISFTNLTSTAGVREPVSYLWRFGQGNASSTEFSPRFQYSQAGTFTVTLTALTQFGSREASRTITVDAPPTINFTAVPRQGVVNVPVLFTDTSTGATGNTLSRRWDFGDTQFSIATETTVEHAYESVGTFDVTLQLRVTHSGTGVLLFFTRTIDDLVSTRAPLPPQASFTVTNGGCVAPGTTVTFTNTSTFGDSSTATFAWNFGDGTAISTDRNPTHRYTAAGSYTVRLTVTTDEVFAPFNRDIAIAEDAVTVSAGSAATPLDDYVRIDESSLTVRQVNVSRALPSPFQGTILANMIELVSQTWRTTSDVAVEATGSAEWRHRLTVLAPPDVLVPFGTTQVRASQIQSDTSLLFITGGSNFSGPATLSAVDAELLDILGLFSAATGTVVNILEQVPAEPVIFTDEQGLRRRTEDEIIAYSYDEYMKSVDAGAVENDWPLLLPMTAAAVRAMDAVQRVYANPPGGVAFVPPLIPQRAGTGGLRIDFNQGSSSVRNFVVAGASKRGWTTWLTAAYERGPFGQNRVAAIVPIVIDVLNMDRQMRHHFSAYGYWSPAIYAYAQEQIFDRFDTVAGQRLLSFVDPYEYRCRLTMPKFIVNASGDQFFLPDSSQFYFDQLEGSNLLDYIPNASHSLTNGLDFDLADSAVSSVLSYYFAITRNGPQPNVSWTFEQDGSIRVNVTPVTGVTLTSARLFRATNTTDRDFRVDTVGPSAWTSTVLRAESGQPNTYVARVTPPATGWTGFFVQMQFLNPSVPSNVSSVISLPFTITTPIRILPKLDTAPAGADDFTTAYRNVYPPFEDPDLGGTLEFRSAGARVLPVLSVHGSPRTMGRQYGRLLADDINAFIPAFLAAAQATNPFASNAALDAAWAIVTAADLALNPGEPSRLAEEVAGIAEGAGISELLLRRANMVVTLENLSGHAVAATRNATGNANALSAHRTAASASVDWRLNLGLQDFPVVVLYHPSLGRGVPHAVVTFAGLSGALTGVNALGQCVGVVADPDEPGDPIPTSGSHFSIVLRRLLNDTTDIRQAEDLLENAPLVRRQHLVLSDGGSLHLGRKAIANLGGLDIFAAGDPADEFAPSVLPNVVYSGPRDGAIAEGGGLGPAMQTLFDNFGSIDENTLDAVIAGLATPQNLVNVIYNIDPTFSTSEPLGIFVSVASGSSPASEQPYVFINLLDFLP